MPLRSCLLALLILAAFQPVATCQMPQGPAVNVYPYPNLMLDTNRHWSYFVRLWMYGRDPLWDPTAPIRWHELNNAEFRFLDEDSYQESYVIRYDPPNPVGDTIYGIYHKQLKFMLWMWYVPARNETPTSHVWQSLAQIGETAKDTYIPYLTPRQNDALGNIDWFRYSGVWYPRTWTRFPNWNGQRWTELWGEFGPGVYRLRYYTVSEPVRVWFNRRMYEAVRVKIVGPSEADPTMTTTEIFTFIDNVGIYSRYIDVITGPAGTPPNTMIFKHLATLVGYSDR